MAGDAARAVIITSRSSSPARENLSSTLAFHSHFIRTTSGLLVSGEIVFGLLVWVLVGGTEYFRVSAYGWVMIVAVLYWVLTVIILILHLTKAYNRISHIPWTTLSLGFNGSATVMYLVSAAVDAASVSRAVRGRNNYNCWAASSFFAFLVTLCYAGSTYFSLKAWRSRQEEQQN